MKREGNMKSASKLIAAASLAVFLAACGGGGGGGSTASPSASPPSTAPQTASALPPQTSVATATYPSGSATSAMYQAINAYRSQMGVGLLRQDAFLDVAAQGHTLYEQTNFNSGAETSLTHSENRANPSYYEAWPFQRGQKAGAPATEWVGEDVDAEYSVAGVSDGAICANTWLNTVYHLQGATGNEEAIGLGYQAPASQSKPLFYCVADFGTLTAVGSNPNASDNTTTNTIPYSGGQQLPTNVIAHAPLSGEAAVAAAMHVETPNPAPDLATPGHPIMVRVNAQAGNTLTVAAFQLVDNTGAPVAARIIVPQGAVAGSKATVTADVNNHLDNGVAFLLPLNPLKTNTTYTATFSGARDGSAMSTTWSFTTGAQ